MSSWSLFITIISIIITSASVIVTIIILRQKSKAMTFYHYKDKASDFIQSGNQLTKALKFCKKALYHAETNEQRSEIWWLIFHIHTHKQIGASEKFSNCVDKDLEWDYSQSKPPKNYQTPSSKELLK
ncbi:MAG: hypothetical protein OXM61_21080 [Candidatus Poribacteria bacterium]|nr:hypothetical protein [Candidatus Poribacteria bacterium]